MKGCNEQFEDFKQIHEEYSKRGKELNRLSKLPLDDKIKISNEEIKNALQDSEKPVVACSFGKDSTVLLYLVRQFKSDVKVIFSNTGIEFPETIKFKEFLVKEWNLNFEELFPKQTFWEIVEKYGFPKESRNTPKGDARKPKCCDILKMNPASNFYKKYNPDLVFVGLTAGEGRSRRMSYIRWGMFTFYVKKDNFKKSNPLLFWKPDDIWTFIKLNDLPINEAYEKYKMDRIGCMSCTGYFKWEEQLARIKPNLYSKIQHMKGQHLIQDYEVI